MQENAAWEGFQGRLWKEEINVRDFVFTPLIINQSNTLTFHFFVMARFEAEVAGK